MDPLLKRLAEPALLIPIVLSAVVLLVALAVTLALRRRRIARPEHRLRSAAAGMITNFVIPDGTGGEILIEYALLTRRGILVLDLRQVEGHVFGSEAMQDWTVLARNRRYTFVNPQHQLHDRVAAIRRLVPETPVTGHIVFGGRADFSRGKPQHVVLLEELIAELEAEAGTDAGDVLQSFTPSWERLRAEAVSAQIGRLLKKG